MQVLALEAMIMCGIGGAEAPKRLGSLLRQIKGSPAQIADLMCDRNGVPTVDVEALLRLS